MARQVPAYGITPYAAPQPSPTGIPTRPQTNVTGGITVHKGRNSRPPLIKIPSSPSMATHPNARKTHTLLHQFGPDRGNQITRSSRLNIDVTDVHLPEEKNNPPPPLIKSEV